MFVTLQVGKTFATIDRVYRAGEVVEVSDEAGESLLSEMAREDSPYFVEVDEGVAASGLAAAQAGKAKPASGKKLTIGKAPAKGKPKVDGDVTTI